MKASPVIEVEKGKVNKRRERGAKLRREWEDQWGIPSEWRFELLRDVPKYGSLLADGRPSDGRALVPAEERKGFAILDGQSTLDSWGGRRIRFAKDQAGQTSVIAGFLLGVTVIAGGIFGLNVYSNGSQDSKDTVSMTIAQVDPGHDSDDDGLTDYQEEHTYQTRLDRWSTYNDGIPDKWRVENGLDVANPLAYKEDPDNDGLLNAEEYQRGTDPWNADTDGDGIKDLDEIIEMRNPLDNSDGVDYDTDLDGMPDWFERSYGLDANSDDSNNDLDNDGVSNIKEYQKSTNPKVPHGGRFARFEGFPPELEKTITDLDVVRLTDEAILVIRDAIESPGFYGPLLNKVIRYDPGIGAGAQAASGEIVIGRDAMESGKVPRVLLHEFGHEINGREFGLSLVPNGEAINDADSEYTEYFANTGIIHTYLSVLGDSEHRGLSPKAVEKVKEDWEIFKQSYINPPSTADQGQPAIYARLQLKIAEEHGYGYMKDMLRIVDNVERSNPNGWALGQTFDTRTEKEAFIFALTSRAVGKDLEPAFVEAGLKFDAAAYQAALSELEKY